MSVQSTNASSSRRTSHLSLTTSKSAGAKHGPSSDAIEQPESKSAASAKKIAVTTEAVTGKKDEKKHENGDRNKTNGTNGHPKDQTKLDSQPPKKEQAEQTVQQQPQPTAQRESPRQKAAKQELKKAIDEPILQKTNENETKKDNKKDEAKKSTEKVISKVESSSSATEKNKEKPSPVTEEKSSVNDKKDQKITSADACSVTEKKIEKLSYAQVCSNAEKNYEKQALAGKAAEIIEKKCSTPSKDRTNFAKTNTTTDSLLFEKDLKGFTSQGEEDFGPLLIDDFEPLSQTSAPATPLKQQLKIVSRHLLDEEAASPRPNYSPIGRISARRCIRPLRETSYQSAYRESYRKINSELDYTTSSMNVTVGSEIPNDKSFSFFGRISGGRKRERTPPKCTEKLPADVEMVENSLKSPKRARLDISGFFGLVASPVTMLRNRFAATRIESSTPNKKRSEKDDNNDNDKKDDIDTGSGIESEAEIAVSAELKEEDVSAENGVEVDFLKENCSDVEIASEIEQQDVLASTEAISRRRMCKIM